MQRSLAGEMGFLMCRLGAIQAAAMGLLGLLLAVVGIYGVVSDAASQGSDVLRLVLRQGLALVIAGVSVGIAAAAVVTRIVGRLLLHVSTTDPLTFLAVTLLLAAVTLAACYVPARRAMRVDPIAALRHE